MKPFGRRDGAQKEPYTRERPYLSGETVTPGGFACLACGHQHTVPQGIDEVSRLLKSGLLDDPFASIYRN